MSGLISSSKSIVRRGAKHGEKQNSWGPWALVMHEACGKDSPGSLQNKDLLDASAGLSHMLRAPHWSLSRSRHALVLVLAVVRPGIMTQHWFLCSCMTSCLRHGCGLLIVADRTARTMGVAHPPLLKVEIIMCGLWRAHMNQRSIQAFAAYLFTGLQPALPPDLQESGLNLKFDFAVADLGKQQDGLYLLFKHLKLEKIYSYV
ncbi:unnamed protein product [Sphagnum troendelagicum]|uniref:Uncharacterized protein n=1 Tax=Sphagnum troendelagicum TaxID=128251 RepID=A0ABP0TSY9_9BRYO